MANLNNIGKFEQQSSGSILDIYFAEYHKGPDYIRSVAITIWNTMTRAAQFELQTTSREMSGGDLALSAQYARPLLVLEYANHQVETALSLIDTKVVT